MDGPIFLTAKEAAARLGCSEHRVKQLVSSGDLKATRLDPKNPQSWIRIKPEWLDEYVATISGETG